MINGKMGVQERIEHDAKTPADLVAGLQMLHADQRDILAALQKKFPQFLGKNIEEILQDYEAWEKKQAKLIEKSGVCPGFF